MFAWWGWHAAGSVHRQTLRSYGAGLKPVVRSLLAEGATCGCPWTARVGRKLLSADPALWTFATAEGVPPHNNAAQRALGHGVIWRKTGSGTDGEAGSRLVGRVLSVVATCRQRGREMLGFLADGLHCRLDGTPAPSLLS